MKKILVRDDLRILGRLAVKELRRELILQKHVATATLHDSINYKFSTTGNGIMIKVYAAKHALFVDAGRKPFEKKVPVKELMKWVLIKGIANDDDSAKSIAFAIREKIYQEGTPTLGSRKLATRRTKFIQIVKKNIQAEAKNMLKKQTQDSVRSRLSEVFRNAQREINNG